MSRSFPSTLIVGWDGATPQLLFPWAAEGKLPAISALIERSAHGCLASVEPPMTLPAWASFLCGVGPGVHGIFDFTAVDAPGKLRFVDARDRATPTLLEGLAAQGLQVGCFLFPTTWPPSPLPGGQISGFDSPVATRVRKGACSPSSLHREIRQLLGRDLSYADLSELRKGPGWEEAAAASLLAGIEAKERLALHLLESRGPYDVFALLFGESDTASHHFWHAHDPSSPRFDPEASERFGGVIEAVYRRLDQALSRLIAAHPRGWDSVVLASDHGFGPASDRVLHLNAFLAEKGFLRFRSHSLGPCARRLRSEVAGRLPHSWVDALARSMPADLTERWEASARFGGLDLAHSFAYSEELNYAPSLRLLPGIDSPLPRSESIERLARALLDWTDPWQQTPIVRRVHRREDLHPGPCSDRAPDLYLELHRVGGASYNLLPSSAGSPPIRRLRAEELRGLKGGAMAGSHREDGVFLLAAPGVTVGPSAESIQDLLPRWLAALNWDVRLTDPLPPGSRNVRPHPAALTRRLQALGYLQ